MSKRKSKSKGKAVGGGAKVTRGAREAWQVRLARWLVKRYMPGHSIYMTRVTKKKVKTIAVDGVVRVVAMTVGEEVVE